MIRVYDCLVSDHNLSLVALAVAICTVSCLVALHIYRQACAFAGQRRLGFGIVSGLVAGLGTWTTHFVGMLAFQPALATGYEETLTALSLLVALVAMGSSVLLALSSEKPSIRIVAGVQFGAAIGAMHFIGMKALIVPGRITWDQGGVVASLGLGMALAAPIFRICHDQRIVQDRMGWRRLAGAAVLMIGAIASLHFVGMSAVVIHPDPSVAVPQMSLSSGSLAIGVALGTGLVFCTGAVAWLAGQVRRREARRLRDFAEATVEGLVVCAQGRIVDANSSFCTLYGTSVSELRGLAFKDLLAVETSRTLAAAASGTDTEGTLTLADGAVAAVSIVKRRLSDPSNLGRTIYSVRDLREQKEAQSRIRFLAHHDALTGLANRTTFGLALDGALEQARADGGTVALLAIDLDNFKPVNDTLGHQAGDEVLREAARRMYAVVGHDDLLARFGGDEFVVLHPMAPSQAGLHPEDLAARLVASMAPDMTVAAGRRAAVGLSIGVAISPRGGIDAERLFADADIALYQAKAEGRGRYRCFGPEMNRKIRERSALISDLRQALHRDQLCLHYQPQVRCGTGELTGFEVLLRWHHPVHGLVPPDTFIPLAEDSGQIVALGEWVLRTACAEAATWERPLRIAVNLSPVQLQRSDLPGRVEAILLETGLPARRLELELTEATVVDDTARELLARLRTIGVQVSMDDFGTGYSSHASLLAFPFDKIKIERSFVAQLAIQSQAAVMVRSMIGLGRSLGIRVVAEGVETVEQMQFLQGESCDEAQGYLIGRPQPIEAFRQEIAAQEIVGQQMDRQEIGRARPASQVPDSPDAEPLPLEAVAA